MSAHVMTRNDYTTQAPRRRVRAWMGWALATLLPACSSKGCTRDQTTEQSAAEVPAPAASTTAPAASRKRSLAVQHLPADCEAVARLQWAALAAHPALAPHLRAAYDPPESARASVSAEQRAFLHFLDQADIDPTKDVEQIAVCMRKTTGAEGLLVILGGNLPAGVLKLMKLHAPKGTQYEIKERDGIEYLELEGQYLIQAEDNAVLLGRDFEALAAAYPSSGNHETYALPKDDQVGIVARGQVLTDAFAEPIAKTPFKETLPGLQRISAAFDFERGHLALLATMDGAERAKQLQKQLQQMMKELIQHAESAPATVRLVMAPNVALARQAKFELDGAQVRLALDLPEQMIDALVMQLLGPAPTRPPRPPPSGFERPLKAPPSTD